MNVAEDDLVSLTLLGLPKISHSYQELVNIREKIPIWENLWSNLVQENIRWNTREGSSSKGANEEKISLVGKANKGKGIKNHPYHEPMKFKILS